MSDAHFLAMKATAEAFQDLALRLWCDDRPEDPHTIASIHEWVSNLPEAEAAAFNGMLGENFGKGPAWDSDDVISTVIREMDDDEAEVATDE